MKRRAALLKENRVARPKAVGDAPGTKRASALETGWTRLTWDDLEQWAGSRSVARGRTYQRGGRVKDLKVSEAGVLLATVMGSDRYVTTVALGPGQKRPSLESVCTCPLGISGCKHAVAVVADYLQALANGRAIPVANEDDPRWARLDSDQDDEDDDWNDEDIEDEYPVRRARSPRTPARRQAGGVNWDDKIEQHLRAKSQGELADLTWSLVRRFPEVYQEFRERLALQEGNIEQLLNEARREIRRVTSEPAWQNHWNGEGHIPDYGKVKHRFERLLDLGHADEVVSLGREFLREGQRQVNESHDEGETALAFADCLAVVFQAVMRSSLSGPERLLLAIDAELDDDIDAIGEASAVVFDAPNKPEDWSVVADTLAQRLNPDHGRDKPGEDSFSRDYRRDRITGWIARALEEAGRDAELRTLYEAEARATGSYERLVMFLLEQKHFEDVERWAREGIAATSPKLPGIAANLAANLCELAQKRKQWDVVAAHAAHKFFSDYPGPATFDELVKAARKAGVEEPVRTAALRVLETGAMPYQVIAPRPAAAPAPRTKSSARGRVASTRPAPPPSPAPPDRVKLDPSWPLPIPDYLIPLLHRPGRFDEAPRPHLDVLLQMAITARRPDEVLRWFDAMRSRPKGADPYAYNSALSYADRVAEAVSPTHPERALEIYQAALNAQLPHAQQSSYEAANGYLRKLRPIFEALGRSSDWTALLASIREKYRNRPRFMELLDGLEGRTIVQSARPRRK
jgi:uncharacterized Zn finger protein